MNELNKYILNKILKMEKTFRGGRGDFEGA
jgi:hypothetical protein